MNRGAQGAVLITGVYGSGKSSVAQQIADLLEKRNAAYALLDLDFLGWFDTSGEGGPTEHSVMLKNLAALVGNYMAVGVRLFVLASAIRDGVQLDGIRAELPMSLRVVRLTVPLPEIEERLHPLEQPLPLPEQEANGYPQGLSKENRVGLARHVVGALVLDLADEPPGHA